MLDDLRARLNVPQVHVAPTPAIEDGIADSLRYLASDAALRSLAADPYWPKWQAPWWHMVVLWELGEARRIPERAVRAMLDALNALPIKIFPIHPGDAPEGSEAFIPCHCALGSIYQVLAACGVAVDHELPWAAPWFIRYQMADGGLTCDNGAYLASECPSSMVGTISPFEAMLLGAPTPERERFLERGAAFLVGRQLIHGSATVWNADERTSALSWPALCFPRLYFYDVLRGLAALARWAERSGAAIPAPAVTATIARLTEAFPDGVVTVERRSYENRTTLALAADGTWKQEPASPFPLLDATSVVGAPSAPLTRVWAETRRVLLASTFVS